MKTLTTLTAAVLMVLSFSSFAADETQAGKLEMNYALQTYINAITQGKIKDIAQILDNDIKLTYTQGNKIMNFGKDEIMNSMKINKNIVQNCSTDFSIIQQGTSQVMAKVVMKYNGFSRINFLTIANTSAGWKITSITSSFE